MMTEDVGNMILRKVCRPKTEVETGEGEGGGENSSRCKPKTFLGRTDPMAIYNLCLILKTMLQKSCCKYNVTLSATAFIYTQT
jgi:hypothetical protein